MTVSCGGPITALDLSWRDSRSFVLAPDWSKTKPVFQSRLMTELLSQIGLLPHLIPGKYNINLIPYIRHKLINVYSL